MNQNILANALVMIQNASLARKKSVCVPYSKLILNIIKIMKEEGFVKEVEVEKFEEKKEKINVYLRYFGFKRVVNKIKLVSKQSRRIYITARSIRKIFGGIGISILSTSKGVMTGEKAKSENLGGEFLCKLF